MKTNNSKTKTKAFLGAAFMLLVALIFTACPQKAKPKAEEPPAPSEYTPVAYDKLKDYLQKLPPGDTEQKIRTGFKELVFLCDEKGEEKGCREMRKRFAAYTKGIPDGSKLRQELVQASTIEEYKNIIQNYFQLT
nr:hypothetical protein [Treponema sp. OMZ 788]